MLKVIGPNFDVCVGTCEKAFKVAMSVKIVSIVAATSKGRTSYTYTKSPFLYRLKIPLTKMVLLTTRVNEPWSLVYT